MATETIPTTVTPEATALAKEYGVERELEAILEKGREMVRGLRGLRAEAEPVTDMGERCIAVVAEIEPAFEKDPSFVAWWSYRFEAFGLGTGAHFVVCASPLGDGDER
jgi:hypothetical protein